MPNVAIVQSNFVPWRGYFDLIAAADVFVLYDDIQYTRRDWRNRNQIKTPSGLQWLTVPVLSKGQYTQSIRDTRIDGADWRASHLRSLKANYSRAAHFRDIEEWLAPLYEETAWETISDLNAAFIRKICDVLEIRTEIRDSSEFSLSAGRTERLADICSQLGADRYISGPAAQTYLDEGEFKRRGIDVEWFDYAGFPDYPQLWGAFIPNVTILDLLFNCGPESAQYLRNAGPR